MPDDSDYDCLSTIEYIVYLHLKLAAEEPISASTPAFCCMLCGMMCPKSALYLYANHFFPPVFFLLSAATTFHMLDWRLLHSCVLTVVKVISACTAKKRTRTVYSYIHPFFLQLTRQTLPTWVEIILSFHWLMRLINRRRMTHWRQSRNLCIKLFEHAAVYLPPPHPKLPNMLLMLSGSVQIFA